MCGPKYPRSGQSAHAVIDVVRYEELRARGALKALLAVPRHVLDHQQRAIHDQDIIQHAVPDDCAVRALNHAWQHAQPAGRRIIRSIYKNIFVAALDPVGGWRVDSFLHVRAVEVDESTSGLVGDGTREAKDVPEEGAGGGDLVDVEAGIDLDGSVINLVPKVAVWF